MKLLSTSGCTPQTGLPEGPNWPWKGPEIRSHRAKGLAHFLGLIPHWDEDVPSQFPLDSELSNVFLSSASYFH
eukprot:jgi/Botrbrau1/5774/Bobra.0134s0039.1